jgi:hypothetical protein
LDPSWVAEQFWKVFPAFGDVRRLTMLLECFAAGPLLDEREAARMIEVEKQIVSDASIFLPSWGNEAFEDLAQLRFLSRLGVQVSDNINFHGRYFLSRGEME